MIDTKSRVILGRRTSRAASTAEREQALAILDAVLEKQEDLGLPERPEVLSADAGYGAGHFVTDVLERGILPHVPLLAGEAPEEVPTWKRRTFDLERQRKRAEKVRLAVARNRVRELHGTRGYQVSRKLRIRNEHTFAEAKTCHGMRRARCRGLERVDIQMQLTATVQNLKRLAAFVRRRPKGAAAAARAARAYRMSGRGAPHARRFLRSFCRRTADWMGQALARILTPKWGARPACSSTVF